MNLIQEVIRDNNQVRVSNTQWVMNWVKQGFEDHLDDGSNYKIHLD